MTRALKALAIGFGIFALTAGATAVVVQFIIWAVSVFWFGGDLTNG